MPGQIAAGRTDHISATRSEEFPVQLESRRDGSVEWSTIDYAVDRLSGYYQLDDEDTEQDVEDWIRRRLSEGVALHTMSFTYSIPQEGAA